MIKTDLEKVVRSLSATEKKMFKRNYGDAAGIKSDYMCLFDIIIDSGKTNTESYDTLFRQKFPEKSFDNTAAYLFKLVTDMLIQVRIEQDKWYARHYEILRARLCFERSVPRRGRKALAKAQQLAEDAQDNITFYEAARMELNHIADSGFASITEQELVNKQMRAKLILQNSRKIQEHYSLYELLSFRLTLPDVTESKKLNDLLLSEISIITSGSQHQFESKKLHLLFQAFFFIHSTNYEAALKMFKELNTLFEKNPEHWSSPPYDYLSALDGILDSLRTIKYFDEMAYFINRAKELQNGSYTEHFDSLVLQTAHLYQLNMLAGQKNHAGAMAYLDSMDNALYDTSAAGYHEKSLEILFFTTLTFFNAGNFKIANKHIRNALHTERSHHGYPVYRTMRLLYLLIHAELNDTELLDYEVRAYKRAFCRQEKALITEKLVIQTINLQIQHKSVPFKKQALKKMEPLLAAARADKREQQLLKFYDFTGWVSQTLAVKK